MARKCSVKTNTSAASRHRRASSHFDKVFELHIFPVTYNKVTKKYRCNMCGRETKQKSNFRTHTKTHFNFKDIRCEYSSINREDPGPAQETEQELKEESDQESEQEIQPVPAPGHRCEFRTRDPGSYTRHKKLHGINKTKCADRANDPDVTLDLDPSMVSRLAGCPRPAKVVRKPAVVPQVSVTRSSSPNDPSALSLESLSITPPPAYSLDPAFNRASTSLFAMEPAINMNLAYPNPTPNAPTHFQTNGSFVAANQQPLYHFGMTAPTSYFNKPVASHTPMTFPIYDQENVNVTAPPIYNSGLTWPSTDPRFEYGAQRPQALSWNGNPPAMMQHGVPYHQTYNF